MKRFYCRASQFYQCLLLEGWNHSNISAISYQVGHGKERSILCVIHDSSNILSELDASNVNYKPINKGISRDFCGSYLGLHRYTHYLACRNEYFPVYLPCVSITSRGSTSIDKQSIQKGKYNSVPSVL